MSYQKDALRTKSGLFFGERIPFSVLIDNLVAAQMTAEDIDAVKKALYYGKNTRPEDEAINRHTSINRQMRCADAPKWQDVIHGVLGVISESGEMAEALLKVMEQGSDMVEFDPVNMAEEIGDVMWYLAIMAEALDTDLETIQATNIAKLRARFPDKFTEDNALNRNLSAERAILETHPQQQMFETGSVHHTGHVDVDPSSRIPVEGREERYGRVNPGTVPEAQVQIGTFGKMGQIPAMAPAGFASRCVTVETFTEEDRKREQDEDEYFHPKD